MKRLGVVGVVVALAMTLFAGSAIAGPNKGDWHPPGLPGDPYTCDGGESMVFGGNGRSAWLNGELYQATEYYAEVYSLEDGSLLATTTYAWGKGPASDSEVTCEVSFVDDDYGIRIDFTVTAVKVPGH